MSEEIETHVLERYDMSKKLGRGAYGIVWKATDKRSKKVVALKKVFEAFQNSVDAQRTYREVMYLQELNGHDNIVRLLGIIRAHNNRDLYLVFEYMETDLHAVIKAKILQSIHKQFIFYQLLKALKYIHSADLIHRDLKPSNLLINSECIIKVADFGLARSVAQKDDGKDPIVSDYVATRWYRAPEILLGSQSYNKAVDMWSAGCILAELISGKVLFTGKSTANQIELIIELLGRPSNEEVESLGSPLAWNILANITTQKTKSFTQIFSSEGKDALDLLRKLLAFSPSQRITVEDALKHPYVRNFHCAADEINCNRTIKLPVDDNTKLSLKEYREAIYKDISEKTRGNRKTHQDNLPRITDKIKSLASKDKEKGDLEQSTTLGDKRHSHHNKVSDADSKPRRTLPDTGNSRAELKASEKVKVYKSFDFGNAKQAQIMMQHPKETVQQPKTIKNSAKHQYKSLDVSHDKLAGSGNVNVGLRESSKWFRPTSPPQLKNKRISAKKEDSQHSSSLSKINMKSSFSLVDNKENTRIKKSSYLLGSGISPVGQHKKSASQAQIQFSNYNLKSPGKDKTKEDIQIVKKSGSNYFFKKSKSKQQTNEDIDKASRLAKLTGVTSQKSVNYYHGKF